MDIAEPQAPPKLSAFESIGIMKLPSWFRILWWAGLTIGLSRLLWPRANAIRSGHATPEDVVLTVIWLALALIPVFSELELWGFKFKAHVEALEKTFREETQAIRNDIRNAVDLHNHFSPSIVLPPLFSDEQLSELQNMIHSALGSRPTPVLPEGDSDAFILDDTVKELFSVRYALERELRRVEARQLEHGATILRPATVPRIVRWLVDRRLITTDVGRALQEIYVVCSNAIHGNAPNEQQLAFVRDVAPSMLSVLKSIESDE